MNESVELNNDNFVVADLNIFRSMQNGAADIPGNYGIILLDILFNEIIGTDKPAAIAMKLRKILENTSSSRLFIGKIWEAIAIDEEPGIESTINDVIHWNMTKRLRDDLLVDNDEWPSLAQQLQAAPEYQEYIRRKSEFIEWRSLLASESIKKFGSSQLNEWNSDSRGLVEMTREPSLILGYAPKSDPRFNSSEWQNALNVFPDRHAVGRWWRLIVWYGIQHAMSQRKRETNINDWEDAQYALLGTYAGIVVTRDKKLSEAISVVSPNTIVLDEWPH